MFVGGPSCSGNSNASTQTSTAANLQAKGLAPQFNVVDFTGKPYSLADYRGQKVLLVFYMGYFCGGCRDQLTQLAKSAQELKSEATVLAISVDSPSESAKMNQLVNGSFPLISDPQLKIIRAYDAEMSNMASPMADDWYIIIDRDGQIRQRINDPLFGQNRGRILKSLKDIQ